MTLRSLFGFDRGVNHSKKLCTGFGIYRIYVGFIVFIPDLWIYGIYSGFMGFIPDLSDLYRIYRIYWIYSGFIGFILESLDLSDLLRIYQIHTGDTGFMKFTA